MASERIQRQIDALLDEAEQAIRESDWALVRARCQQVLVLDPGNGDATVYLAAADRAAGLTNGAVGSGQSVVDAAAAGPNEVTGDRDAAGSVGARHAVPAPEPATGNSGLDSDLSPQSSRPYIVTELMGGGDVEGLIEKASEHRLPLERTLEIGIAVCRGLEFAHSQGIVHRDLKPGNVWLTADGTAKLGDFGLAVALDKSRLTQGGMMVGTVSYMPPEQAMGGEVTPQADLYSLGAMLYEMVTGRPPFVGDESVAIITQHLNVAPVAPSWHNPAVPPGLEAVILRLLEKDPTKRPDSAAEVRAMLGGIAATNLSSRPPSPRGKGENGSSLSSAGRLGPPQEADGRGEGETRAGDEARAAPDNPMYRRTFVGREVELRQLQAAYDAATSGQGSLVMVVGEPGIGKTSVCEQLATYAAIRGGRTLIGHCYEEGSLSLPYLPFVEAMRSYVLTREPQGLRQDLGSGAVEVSRIVSEIRERLQVEPSPSSGDPQEERYRLFQAVTSFLRNAAIVQPLEIVLEDLHDADHGTLDLLLHVARNLSGSRLLLVGSYRDIEVDRSHPLSATLAELRRASSFRRVLLRGLSADEVQRMLSVLSGQEVAWRLAEAVHRQTEGNPLFIQEVLRYLVEEGLIKREDGRWRRASDETPLEMGIPEGLRDVIGKRLARLSVECNRVLAMAAVIGREFELATLQTVAGGEEDPLVAAMEEATRVAVLQEQERVGGVRYRFAHAFFRQTLCEELSAPRRLRLHQQIARALEQQYHNRLEEHAAELAEHFAQSTDAADLRKAVAYAELAAQRALAVHAYGEAARHLEQALEVQEVLDPDDRAKRCDLLLALGEALNDAGQPRRALDGAAPEAFTLAETLADDVRVSRTCRLAIFALLGAGSGASWEAPEASQWAARADRYAHPETSERAWADLCMGLTLYSSGRPHEGMPLLERALNLARRLAEPDLLCYAAFNWILNAKAPQHEMQRLGLAKELTALAPVEIRVQTLSLGLLHAADAWLGAGMRAEAEHAFGRLRDLAERTKQPNAVLRSMLADAALATLDGRLAEAADLGDRIEVLGDELGLPVSGGVLADLARARPRYHLGKLGPVPQLVVEPQARATLDAALAARGAEAKSMLDRFVVARPGIGTADDETSASVDVEYLEAAVLVGHQQAAELLLKRLTMSQLQTTTGWFMPTIIARHLAAASALLGEPEQARAYYDHALEVVSKIRFRPEIALTHLGIAELLLDQAVSSQPLALSSPPATSVGDGDRLIADKLTADGLRSEALQHLDFAIAEFREMKMQPSLERALRHKEVLKA